MKLSTNSLLTSMLISTLLLTACGDKTQAKSETATPTATATPTSDKTDTAVIKALQDNLDKSSVTIKVTNAIATQMPDMYWVSFDNAPSMFTDKSGTYLIQGQIAKLGDGEPVDIAQSIQGNIAKDLLSQVPESEQIIFTAQGDKKSPHLRLHRSDLSLLSKATQRDRCHHCRRCRSPLLGLATRPKRCAACQGHLV